MNRQQRRAAQFKRHHYDRNLGNQHLDATLNRLALNRVYDAEKSASLMNDARLCWHRLTHGDGNVEDFDTLGEMANVAQNVMLAGQADEFVIETFERGIESLNTMRTRYERTHKFGADATALQTVPDLLDAMGVIYQSITPLQATSALLSKSKNTHMEAHK